MYLAIDIGGTFIKYALMDSAGTIVTKGKQSTPRVHLAGFMDKLYSIIEGHDLSAVKGIALSCPGTVDAARGVIYHGGSLPFLHEVNLKQEIERRYGIDAFVENDGKSAALAELWLGSVKNAKDSVVLILGSGIGGGIIIDGKLHRGVNLSAGEVSYIMHQFNPETKTGQYFGLDCSAVNMIRRIAEIKKVDSADGEVIFEYIMQGDAEANAIFDEYCLYLAIQILNLQYILDPEVIAIGGGISAQPVLIERIQRAIADVKEANPLHIANPKVVACQFRNDANLYGALYHYFVSKEKLVNS
ncbi:putative NBD/HSP70 family sugar kinase [Paenibacillus sp. RC254]|uniref:ROK family protein n=1 Tax=unclassified Paenibacillus TaxID=185978 RepID=UPI0024BA6267|nr:MULTISPECIES: ROK family protein [unclassified Paenibacillus]